MWFTPAASIAARGGTPLTTIRVASGLIRPVHITFAPGDSSRLFIVEQAGKIKVLEHGVLLGTPFLDIDSVLVCCGERGLLGLAFHPNYAMNGFFFLNYFDNAGNTVIARYTVSNDPNVANPKSAQIVLTIEQPTTIHNGGWLGFGPDGYLYIATGDGGPWFDPSNRAQTITGEWLGKILRVDVDRDDWSNDPDRNYGVPPDNPFVGRTGDDEIWALGLRNPWRCAFDSETGDLYIADVGQNAWEEINIQSASSAGGENYGWRCMEASTCTGLGGCACDAPALTPPIHAYAHAGPGCFSVTGGEVYRGCAIPDLLGTYFFADWCTSRIWSFRFDGGVVDFTERTEELAPGSGLNLSAITSFGRDADGELYLCAWGDGDVFKIVPVTAATPLAILASDPPSGSIDARQPFEPDGTRPAGLQSLLLSLDRCPPNLDPGDFVVDQQGGSAPAPGVVEVEPLGGADYRIVLDRRIEPGSRVTVTHVGSGAAVTFAWLPGDVNRDGRSDLADVMALITLLTDGGAATNRSTDIDRSGTLTPHDLLRTIDLLLGAGVYDSYNGAMLP